MDNLNMRKSIIGIIMAVTLVGSSLAFPVQAYAADVEAGQVVGTNDDGIGDNHGTVETNNGTVEDNDGIVGTNNGTVETNNGTVVNNDGIVETNSGTVAYNIPGGTVDNNFGTVDNNSGTVAYNNSGGTVDDNFGTVETNYGTVITNDATVTINNGTVVNNDGIVETNSGTVAYNIPGGTVDNNFGTVETNYGTVVNNFGGTVNGGTVTNQWYEYILTDGSFKSGSTLSKDADNRTWIGKAGSTDNVLGDFYITVAANDGMTFDYATINGGRVQGITNADGSISFGNISSAIRIFFKQFINNNNNNNAGGENTNNTNNGDADNNTNNSSDSDTNNADMMATIESIIANEEAMPVTSFISDEAVAKIPEAAKSTGASYNLSVIISSQGFMAAINKISEVVKAQNATNNAGGRITSTTIYSEKPMLFTADVLNAISASDIDFVFVFMHNGKMYKVTIPRGAKIDFTGHACEGPLYFGQILGTTEEIR